MAVRNGTAAADTLNGTSGADTLNGAGGNDTLVGGTGIDRLNGGSGNDFYVIGANPGDDVFVEAAGGGTDTVLASVNYSLALLEHIENLTLTGSGNRSGTGNDENNVLTGNSGNNTLDGGAGNDLLKGEDGNDSLSGGIGRDTMLGGDGNDTYVLTQRIDVVEELEDEGIDTVRASFSLSLGENVENLVLTGAADIDGNGNELANSITGNGGDNVVYGAAGNDILAGGSGDDELSGGAGADSLSDSAGDDFLSGGAGADTLDGGAGSDELSGGAGNDVLVWDATDISVAGGSGTDILAVDARGASAVFDGSTAGRIRDIEKVDLGGAAPGTVVATSTGVVNLSNSSDTLLVKGDAGDLVSLGGSWTRGADVVNPLGETGTYETWLKGEARVLVDSDVAVHTRVFELSSLDGANGFRIGGETADAHLGISVDSAGDVNGDGLDDIVVRANHEGAGGVVYVIFAEATGFGASLDLATLDGTNGFRVEISGSSQSTAIASAGDINGDGFADVIVGADMSSGYAHVFFGKAAPFVSSFHVVLSDEDLALSGSSFAFGYSVASAGDVNGDGFDDVLVGLYNYSSETVNEKGVFVVFGETSFPPVPAALPGDLNVAHSWIQNWAGFCVASAGDMNGDGLADIVLSEPDVLDGSPGSSWVVFGNASGFPGIFTLPSITNGVDGFRLNGVDNGDNAGHSVASAGDINGDGYSDLIVGAYRADGEAGESYVVFGKASGFQSVLELSSLDGENGFRLDGTSADDEAGFSVASAGDVNGDGYDDLIIGAHGAGDAAGATYVVFGKAEGFDASLTLSALDGLDGFRLDGTAADDRSGISATSAGDVNGDGYADLIIGADGADDEAGATYVVYGANFTGAVDFAGSAGADLLDNGTAEAEAFVAGRGNDTMVGGGGVDVFRGGAGNDRIVIADLLFRDIDGGGNTDTLAVSGGLDLELTQVLNNRITGIEVIDLIAGAGDNDLTLTKLDLFTLSNTNANVITVNGGASDSITIDGEWLENTVDAPLGYREFASGAATLRVQSLIDVGGIELIT